MVRALVGFSIRFPGVVCSLALVLSIYGAYLLPKVKLDVFPEFSANVVVVQTESAGMPTSLVESQVTQRVEAALAGTIGLQSLRSQSIPGLSIVTAQFEESSSILRNRQTISERLAGLTGQLPPGVAPPRITPFTSSTSTTLGIGVTAEQRSLIDQRTLVDTVLRPHLLSAAGVADVNVFGGDVRQWQIQLDSQRLQQHRMTGSEVLAALRGAAVVRGAGFVENRNQRLLLSVESQPLEPENIARLPLRVRPEGILTVADVATVAVGAAPSISGAVINGRPGVFLLAQAQFGSSIPQVTAALERAVEDVRPVFEREGMTLDARLFRPANFIETALGNVRSDVIIGSVLVLAVLFLFLFNLRTALISAAAIPLSLLAAIIVLHHWGVGLNLMAIAGLAIALGEVVDDAIIDMENIFRRLREHQASPKPGVSVEQVVFDASMEVRASVIYATFIVALVFYPLLTLTGVAGKLFFSLGLAYLLALMASLLVAMTVTPALCLLLLARWRKPLTTRDPPLVRWMLPRYRRGLQRIARWPRSLLVGTGLLMALAVAAGTLFRGEFLPPLKEGHYIVHLAATPGTSRDEAMRVGAQVAQRVRRIEGVRSTAQWVGRAPGGPDTAGIHYSEMHVELGRQNARQQARILADIRRVLTSESDGVVGLTLGVNTFLAERIGEIVSGFSYPVVVHIFGTASDRIEHDARKIAQALEKIPGAVDVQVQAPSGHPELAIRLLPDRLRSHGVLAANAIEAITLAYDGAAVGQVYEESRATPMVIQLAAAERRSITRVGDLQIRSEDGRLVALRDIATLSVEDGQFRMLRLDGKRVQTVTANLRGRDLGKFESDLQAVLTSDLKLAPGNYAVAAGLGQARNAARQELWTAGLLAGVGIFALLYVALGSTRNVALTFLNLPFALIGGVAAVLLADGWVSVGSMVGFVTLFGITLRNSIMLVTHCQYLVDVEGLPWGADTALRAACERLPSILMTAIVTALALLPLALNAGEPGREIEGPMAAVIVGGLVSSTLLNLLVLPTVLVHFGRFVRARTAAAAG